MAKHTDTDMLMSMHFQRLKVFQLVVTLINAAQAIVGQSVAITKVKENYDGMMKRSLEALHSLNGGAFGPKPAGPNPANATGDSHQRFKRPKIVEVPKFDVNKPGMQTFLNSMALVTKSFKFDSDKELASYYLNNLTESSKSLIFSIYPLNDASFYENSSKVIQYLESFISPNIQIDATRDIRALKMGNGSLTTYYHSFTRIVSDLGADSMSQKSLMFYFIAGLNSDAVRNTNLYVHMH